MAKQTTKTERGPWYWHDGNKIPLKDVQPYLDIKTEEYHREQAAKEAAENARLEEQLKQVRGVTLPSEEK